MTLRLTEEAVETVKTYFESNLVTHIGTVNSEYNDENPLSTQVTYLTAEEVIIPQPPAIMILGESGTVINDQSPTYLSVRHDLTIICIVAHPRQSLLRQQAYRLVKASVRTLLAMRNAPSVPQVFWLEPWLVYSPIYTPADQGQLFMDAQIRIAIDTEDVNPLS